MLNDQKINNSRKDETKMRKKTKSALSCLLAVAVAEAMNA